MNDYNNHDSNHENHNNDHNDGNNNHEQTASAEPVVNYEEVKPETAETVESTEIATEEEHEPEVANITAPRGGDFNWSDVRNAVEFTRVFMEKDSLTRSRFRYLLDFGEDVSVVEILASLTPPGGKVSSINFIKDYMVKLSGGELGFMDGVRISGELSNFPDDSKRLIFATLNTLGNLFPKGEEVTAFRYRRNWTVQDVFNGLNTGVEQLDMKTAIDFLNSAKEILSTWVSI